MSSLAIEALLHEGKAKKVFRTNRARVVGQTHHRHLTDQHLGFPSGSSQRGNPRRA